MSQHRLVDEGTGQQPSHLAIDKGNPAQFKSKILILDDVNVDLISLLITAIAFFSVFFIQIPILKVFFVTTGILLPLRIFLPFSQVPQGLALITGASSGIGAELSYIFADRGHDLILVGRNEDQLAAVKTNIEQKSERTVHTIASDLSIPGAAKQLYDHVKSQGHNVDILVNDAGLGGAGETLEQPIEFAERMITLNCIALVQLTQLFGRDMAARGRGWILQISSVGGWMATPHHNIYHATKHFVRAFSEALSVELRAYPGLVNTQLMPGPVHTQFVPRAHAEELFMMSAPGMVEDPKLVARAGYKGLCKGKRMVFSSWNAAGTSLAMRLVPRSVHVTFAGLMNAPMRGWMRMNEPKKDQRDQKADVGRQK